VRSELLTLSRDVADRVARHLVAAGQIIDEDADLAMAHAVAARRLASRVAVVREAVGLTAYAAGDWATAITELRTYHRMTGKQTHLAEIADSERALGRPERAIDLYRGADMQALDKAGAIELLIVAAGARADLGQHDAAVSMLKVPELTAYEDGDWAARLRYAYADALLAAGRREDAREWFSRTAAIDHDDTTDAAERLLELDGITIEDDTDVNDEPGADMDDEPGADVDDELAVSAAEDPPADDNPAVLAAGEPVAPEAAVAADEPAVPAAEDSAAVNEPVDTADADPPDGGDFAARTRTLSFMDAPSTGEASPNRLAEDLDGGIDGPTDESLPAEVDGGVGDIDTISTVDDEKAAEDTFVDAAPADEDGADGDRQPA
jgi:tetratricopeptide (TPR) repeat protein